MRATACRILALALVGITVTINSANAQTVNPDDIMYITPYWFPFTSASDTVIANEVANLRSRLGPEGTHVKLGFSAYIAINMTSWTVDISNPTAVRAALAATSGQLDDYIARAERAGIPLVIAFQTAIRERVDAAQTASQTEDVRNMMWYADNELATGWWTHTRYARKQYALQEAYIRELGKMVAEKMRLKPNVLVAVSGDGEQELATARAGVATPTVADIYSDFSPFAVAEFRDWVRLGGLYAIGQKLGGQGYSLGARYVGDATPDSDTNGDGHTFNGNFGTTFTTWDLKHFDWSLTDWSASGFHTADPKAISQSAYNALPSKLPVSNAGGFDPPRVPMPIATPNAIDTGNKFWDLWVVFKQTMLHRHNIDFAKWMTTSADSTGATVSPKRFYSNQIAADYLFGGTPAVPNLRWHGAMSSLSTADVSPYGGLGITAFNLDFSAPCGYVDQYLPQFPELPVCYVAKTLAGAAPRIAARNVRWGLIEWNPGLVPGDTPSPRADLFASEMALVEKYWPRLLQPFYWGSTTQDNKIEDTVFESSMKSMIARIKNGKASAPTVKSDIADNATISPPLTFTGFAVDTGGIPGPDATGTGVNAVQVYWAPASSPNSRTLIGTATYGATRTDAVTAHGSRYANSGYSITLPQLAPGAYLLSIHPRSTITGTFLTTATATVPITVVYPVTATPALLNFVANRLGSGGALQSVTQAQTVTPSYGYTGAGVPNWAASNSSPSWVQVTKPSSGQFRVAVNSANVAATATTLSGTVTLVSDSLNLTVNVPVSLSITLVATQAPFGGFDTPIAGSAQSGSINVSGWALDDLGIDRVEIWRDRISDETAPAYPLPGLGNGKIFVTNALFIPGARPDVAALYPASPFAQNAGWGYLLLSTGLAVGSATQGNGTFTFHAFAYDVEGKSASLGSKTVVINNASAIKPFGNIDTPINGETVSTSFWNFGWALTPPATPTCRIVNGNVFMSIDSGALTPVAYGDLRTDIQGAFPGYSNSAGAGGAFYVHLAGLTNGLHQIGWYVVDDCNRAEGIGSRFFMVVSDTANAAPPTAAREAASRVTAAPVQVVRGDRSESVAPDASGSRIVRISSNERVEVVLPDSNRSAYTGYSKFGGEQKPLPVGSSIDAKGTFYWQPGPAFLGSFDLEFVAGDTATAVRVVVGPSARLVVDTPQAGATVGGSFAIGGWAIDLAGVGSGVDAVDVWAYPVGTADENPIFVGSSQYGGGRSDVAAIYGPAYEPAGYDLTANGLTAGAYDLVVSARSTATGTFDVAQVVRVTVQ